MGCLIKFFAITYAVTWTCFISVAALPIPAPYRNLMVLLGAFSPSLAALSLTARDEGSTGVRSLLRRVVQWQVSARWCLFAAGYIVVIKLAVAVTHRAVTGAWPRFGTDPIYIIPFAIIFSSPFRRERRSAGAGMRFRAWRRGSDLQVQASCWG